MAPGPVAAGDEEVGVARVAIESLYKTFPPRDRGGSGVSVLRRVDLAVADGEFLVLVGPSGCGKSTLLRAIAGLEQPTGGRIWVGDREVTALPPKARDMAMVFQSYALYPHLTVYDNLAFGLRRMGLGLSSGADGAAQDAGGGSRWRGWGDRALVGLTRGLPEPWRYRSSEEVQVAERVNQVAAMLQIEGLLGRLPKELSGGQKQRVALGRAIARQPSAFLMDEPLSNLDAKLRAETRSQLVQLQKRLGTTTIYVTHDQVEAMTMGDRVAVMNGGQIQQLAPPLEIYRQPANRFVAEFIGSPAINLFPVWVKAPTLLNNGDFRMTLPELWGEPLAPYDGRALLLGIRPEHWQMGLPAPKNLPVQIQRLEALGAETIAHVEPLDGSFLRSLDAGASALGSWQVRLEGDHTAPVGEQLWLSIPPERMHLFDPATGAAVRP